MNLETNRVLRLVFMFYFCFYKKNILFVVYDAV